MYLDSAILVKLVVREQDSDFYADLVEGQFAVCSSELAIVECRSALLRKKEQGQIDTRTCNGAWARLRAHWSSGGGLVLHPVTLAVLQEAGEIIQPAWDMHRSAHTTPSTSHLVIVREPIHWS